MQYKTVVLELLESQLLLGNRLKDSNCLLSTMTQLADHLRIQHLLRIEIMTEQHLQPSPAQIKSEAFQFEVHKLQQAILQIGTQVQLEACSGQAIQEKLLASVQAI